MNTLRVKELREAAGITQAELAQRAGISEKTVRKIEGGTHSCSVKTALKIAIALQVSLSGLFADEPART